MKYRPLVLSAAALALLALGACGDKGDHTDTTAATAPKDDLPKTVAAAADAAAPAAPEDTGPRAADGTPFVKVADLPAGQWYHARLDFKKLGPLPFYLFLPTTEGTPGYVKNGVEMVPVTWTAKGNQITVVSPWNYPSRLVAKRDKKGALRGKFERDFPLWGHVENPFSAEPVDAPSPETRFAKAPKTAPKADLSGTWRFEFEEMGVGTGHFEQDENGVITGFARPGSFGDLRFLAGNVIGDELHMSQYNGNSINLVSAHIAADGKTMKGVISMYNQWQDPFTAKKDDSFHYESPVHLAKGKNKITIPALTKVAGEPVLKRYAGKKPLVVFIFATWCPICNDAAPYFVELHKKYGDNVAFLSLAYDLSDDQKKNAAEIERFRKKYNVDWDVMQVPTTPEKWADDMPQEIKDWEGFPVSVFINRDGTVHAVYGGWFGPATGDENVEIKAQFADWIEDIAKT